MARISLRAYNRDIEAMIDGGLIDEAFAHCRYILESFPKHIDTYRLMGKALLEAQRFSDASDVFHRVLSSVPDDFIAHLGMSIIREDESNLDAAIWHMERSLEVQPSNAAVQVELRRLYGLRDGLTPQKIQLTRGALARMSAKSNLYTQAIAELRAGLSNDPQRPDLLVVLAEMYAQTGARMEAVETCNSLISKLPYCLVANRILADILPETEHAERAQEFKDRLAELDPYFAQLSSVAPTIEQVPDGAVTIERYEYPGEKFETTQTAQPEWAATLGVNIDEEVEIEEEAPDWLKDEGEQVLPAPLPEDESDYSSEEDLEMNGEEDQLSSEVSEEEELPDWLKAVDQPVDETTSEAPFTEIETEAEQDIIEEQSDGSPAIEDSLPDTEIEQDSDEQQESEPLPDWMSGVESSEEAEISTESKADEEPEQSESTLDEEVSEEPEIETPDWLHEAMAESEEDESHLSAAAGVAAAAGMAAILSDDDQDEVVEEQDSGDLSAEEVDLVAETEEIIGEQPVTESLDIDEESTAASEDTELEGEGLAAAGVAGAAALAGASLLGDDEPEVESFEILESELEDSSFTVDAVTAEAGQSEADIPDWLQDLGEDIGESTTSDEPALQDDLTMEDEMVPPLAVPVPDEGEPETLEDTSVDLDDSTAELSVETSEEEQEIASEFTDAIPDWLSEVSPESAPDLTEKEEGLDDEATEIVQAEIPDWLRKMEQEHKAELAAAGEAEVAQGLEFDSDVTEIAGEDVPSWLMSAMETELPDKPVDISEVTDIGEIISDEDQAEELILEEEVLVEQELDEEITLDIEHAGALAAGAVAAEILSEDGEDELEEAVIEASEEVESEEIAEESEVEIDETLAATTVAAEIISDDEEVELEEAAIETAEDVQAEEIVVEPEIEPAEALAAAVIAAEILSEDEDGELQEAVIEPQEDVEAEEITREPEEMEPVGSVDELLEPSAETIPADEIPLEGDTQPIAVGMREETIADEPVVEPEEAIPTDMDSASEEEFEASELDEEELAVPIEGEDAVPGLAEAEPLPPEDEDAAMAWLESLAAKQGASEEELLTAPEDRLEEPPDWVQDVAAEGEILEETEPEEKIDSAAAAAMAGLAAGTILSDKEETPAEEILESSSDWVPEVVEEQPESVIEATPTVMEEEDEVGEPMEEQIEPEIQEAAGVDLQPTIEEMPPEPPEEPVETEEEAVIDTDISAEEIPDWLSGLAEDEEVEAEPAAPEWTPAMLVEEETESDVVKEPTEAKIDLNAASLSQLERIPGIGFIHAQRILEYRNQAGSFESLDELEKVHGLSTDMINDIKNYLTVEVVVDEAPPVSSHPDLQGAWTNINEGEIDAAVSQYTELIKRDEHLDEVIRDLQEALVKYPQDASLYQSLGDAYMHSNMLDEALDSYNRAEDLIK